MKGEIKFYGPGGWFAQFEEPFEIVGGLLTCDVQRCTKTCDTYLREAQAVAAGEKPVEYHGNSYIVRIMPDSVLIVDAYNEKNRPALISIDAYLSVLRYWKAVVESWDREDPKSPVNPPEFVYDRPEPDQTMPPEDVRRLAEELVEAWDDYEPPHHISELRRP